jgi:hypothetical protein
MGIGAELAGFIVGIDQPFRERLSAFVRRLLSNASEQVRVSVNGFGDGFMSGLSETDLLANQILVRRKESIAAQTSQQERMPRLRRGTRPGQSSNRERRNEVTKRKEKKGRDDFRSRGGRVVPKIE